MKRIFNLILASSVALGFAACNNDRAQNGPENEKATTAMRLVVGEAGTRGISDGQTQDGAVGVGGESKVDNGWFMTRSHKGTLTSTVGVTPFNQAAIEATWTSNVFKYDGTTGEVNAAIVLNKTAEYPDLNAEVTLGTDVLSNVAANTGFTMSSKTSKTIQIISGVSEDDAANRSKNNFDFEVERLASKVQVSEKNGGLTVGEELANKVEFTGLRYAVAGGAKKIYLFGDNAGARTLSVDPEKGAIYKGFKSAIHDVEVTKFKSEDGVWVVDGTPRDVTKVSDTTNTTFSNSQGFDNKSLPIEQETTDNDYQSKSADDGIYFYENSLPDVATELNYNDITYVKFYGTMGLKEDNTQFVIKQSKPAVVYATKDELNAEHESVVLVSNAYKDAFGEDTEDVKFTESGETDTEGQKIWTMTITEKAGTFYLGADNKMYLTLNASRDAGNTTSKKYTAGKMVWKTPANRQVGADGTTVKYADTRRNNIYSLSLTEINGIGDNYDPVDPNDPNIEKPKDNPDEPTVDEKDPVNEVKTYIRVKATILKWNLVHRGVVLN